MRVKLGDVCTHEASSFIQKDLESIKGEYPIYGASGLIKKIDSYHQKSEYIAVVKDGAGIGRVMLLPAKSSVIGTLQYLIPKENILVKYLYYAIKYMHLEKYYSGATIPHIYFKDYKKEEFNLPDFDKQKEVIAIFERLENIIKGKQNQIVLLDNLVKSRFIEMFGDPITNTKNLETKDLRDALILKAGDFIPASGIAEKPDDTNIYPCYGGNGIRGYVSEYNQDGEYSLVGRQGALSGNVQYARGKFKNTEHALLVTPIVEMNSIWLNQLLLNLDLKRYQTGAAQPGLSVKNLQEIQILMVPIADQNEFANFVTQVDKSKFEIQKSLEETQKLFDSLMQEYFG